MTQNIHDVLIVGAGSCGLMAAWELVQTGKKVAIIEARDRIGGRTDTIDDQKFSLPVELGAEFIHGNLEVTLGLLKKAAIPTVKTEGTIWQKKEGQLDKQKDFIEDFSLLERKCKALKNDIPVSQFIQEELQGKPYEELRFTLENYVKGYYAADPRKASTLALCKELTQSDDEQYRVEGGYRRLITYLKQEVEQKGGFFYLSQPAQQINWNNNPAEVITSQQRFWGKKIVITVPLGVLQAEHIAFSPSLDEKMAVAKQLGFGPVIKILLQFETAFWKDQKRTQHKDLDQLGFLFSEAEVPTWWTQYPKPSAQLTGWLAGPNAERVKDLGQEALLQKALESLQNIFEVSPSFIQEQLKAWHIANWATDRFNCGGYAYDVVNGTALRKQLQEPVANTVFFAGEALFEGPEIGTVESALISGRETAYQVIASF